MLLSYRDADFWTKFRANHWQPRVPTVLRQPFATFPFTEAAVLGALKSVDTGLQARDRRIRYIVSVGDKDKAPRARFGELVQHRAESMTQLEANCERVYAKQSFGVMLHEFQSLDPGIWSGVTAFLQDARHSMDFPVPRAFLDLFFGNYASSFVGLHKDTQEIFAFVLRGKKRILAWPFEYFAKVEKLMPAARYFQMRLRADYRKHRAAAIVLDANPGDVIYWPADHWHIAEAEPGRFSTMISLGIFRPEHVLPSEGQVDFKAKLFSGGTPDLRSQDMTEVTPGAEAAQQLRWVTSFGFELGGPMTAESKGAVAVAKKKGAVILWKVIRSRRRLLVAANGHTISLPLSKIAEELLEEIARGEVVSIVEPKKRTRPAKVFETSFNKQVKLATRARVSHDPSGSLVHWLRRVHAVEAFERM